MRQLVPARIHVGPAAPAWREEATAIHLEHHGRQPCLRLPLLLTGVLLGLSSIPRVSGNANLAGSFWGAGAFLLAWQLLLLVRSLRQGRTLQIQRVVVRSHWVQAIAQFSVYAYWGWHWRPVYDHAVLILAQLVFLYAFDMLLCWSRRDTWRLGFGPFPIIFSTNLFLWFRDDWFFLQFLMVSVGALGKELVTWRKEDRRAHIFNPSGLSLSVFSIALILTGSTRLTWGQEIATTLSYPHFIFPAIFLLGLPGQILFSVTLTTLAAASALWLLNLAYTAGTGVYFFLDSNIPIAVFLGLHLLVTDPATSPRSELGRVIFGGMYGAGVFALYGLLTWCGAPTFYDKLLCVPVLNLTIQWLDRFARSPALGRLHLETLGLTFAQRRRNLVHVAVWAGIFSTMLATGFVGPRHEGARIAFWQRACEQRLRHGCRNLLTVLRGYCEEGSGAACNELGLLLIDGKVTERDPAGAMGCFVRACDLGHVPGCTNAAIQEVFAEDDLGAQGMEEGVSRAMQRLAIACEAGEAQSCYVLGSAHAAGRGVESDRDKALQLLQRSCDLGLSKGCVAVARMYLGAGGAAADRRRVAAALQGACDTGDGPSCALLGFMYHNGDGVVADEHQALALIRKACELGMQEACDWLDRRGP